MLDQKTNTIYQSTFVPPSWSDPIQDEMIMIETRLRAIPPGQHEILTSATSSIFNAGGKRVRPSVCLLIAKIFDANIEQALSMAAAVEMLHTATLVHDDLIDGAMLRRGTPTLNALWSPDISVLAGDYLFARAASLIAEVEIVPIMKLFAKTLEIILNGEITQKFSKWQIDRAEYERRIYAKTAALFVLSTHSTALLGGADTPTLNAFIDFGRSIGMAFQIVDDVLDYVGTPDKLGKPIGGDLRQGLFTLPAIIYSENHPDDQDIHALLTLKMADPIIIQNVIRKIVNSGAIEESMGEAQTRLTKGKHALKKLPPSIYKESLLALAEQLVHRDV